MPRRSGPAPAAGFSANVSAEPALPYTCGSDNGDAPDGGACRRVHDGATARARANDATVFRCSLSTRALPDGRAASPACRDRIADSAIEPLGRKALGMRHRRVGIEFGQKPLHRLDPFDQRLDGLLREEQP